LLGRAEGGCNVSSWPEASVRTPALNDRSWSNNGHRPAEARNPSVAFDTSETLPHGSSTRTAASKVSNPGQVYVFLRPLTRKLPRRKTGPMYEFDDDVKLEYYRHQKISEGSVSLKQGTASAGGVPATSVGRVPSALTLAARRGLRSATRRQLNGSGKTGRSAVALWDRCFNAYVRWEPCDGRGLVVAYSLSPRTLELSWHSRTLRS
jgi:hypothetical protein